MNWYLDIYPEAAKALARGKGVVALESTIIPHGMPYPQNVKTALAAEQGIHGKETTPFLLAKGKELAGGDSLDANIQLVFNDARVAAQTAAAYSKLSL